MRTERRHSASLEIPLNKAHIESTSDFVLSYAEQLEMDSERREKLKAAVLMAMAMVVEANADASAQERMKVEVFEQDGRLFVEVLNRGVPLSFEDQSGDGGGSRLHSIAEGLDRFSIENLGRAGQTIVLGMRLGGEAAGRSLGSSAEPASDRDDDEPPEIRMLRPGEEIRISQLFYHVYGYRYVNDFVYYPEKIAEMIREGKLHSMAAVHRSGRCLAHVGLRKWNENPPVYEPCLGVTLPSVKSQGLFKSLFHRLMEHVSEIPMQYCFLDFVTNHEYSQKLVEHYNPCPMALFVGCQSKDYQAKLERLGMGEDPKETDRYSLLFSVLPQVSQPFGPEIVLPNSLGEMLGFLLGPLNLLWNPAPRFEMLPSGGDYQTHLQPAQNAVAFDFFWPGRRALDSIVKDWRNLQKNGYQYAAIDVPLGVRGVGQVHDILCDHGFFVAGFIPHHCSDKLGFRFQAVGPTKLDFGEIKVSSGQGRELLKIVEKSYERI